MDKITLTQILLALLTIILSSLGTLIVFYIKQMIKSNEDTKHEFKETMDKNFGELKGEVSELGKSIKQVNLQVVKLTSNLDWHKSEIDELKGKDKEFENTFKTVFKRLSRLENKERTA